MKKLHQSGFGLMPAMIFLFVLLSLGLAAWQITKNDSNNTGTPTSRSDEGCGKDRMCFYQAYEDNCAANTLETSRSTVEGDPIITNAELSKDDQGCLIKIVVDNRQDKFGDGKLRTYNCRQLAEAENQMLSARSCDGPTEDTPADFYILF